MRYPAEETAEKHSRILKEASRLFRERGFAGVTVSEIMKATGLTHGPFYNHFASKEALMEESVEKQMAESLDEIDNVAASKVGILSYVENYLSNAHCADPGNGCLISALGSEVPRAPKLRTLFNRLIEASIDRYASYMPWPVKKRERGDSIRLLASMVGGIVLARAVDDSSLKEEILMEVKAGIKQLS